MKITKKIISELFKLGKIEDIEAGLLKYFLRKNKINEINSSLINNITKYDKDTKFLAYFMRIDEPIELIDIEKIFELLISSENKRINGAVYTPSFIVDYIVNNTIDKEGTVCDPSCGSGAFLLGAIKRIKTLSGKRIKDIIENYIYGVDIQEDTIRRAKIILTLYAIINGENIENINFNLKVSDSLEVDWNSLFPKIFKNSNGFNYIVGNPPYVRIQDLQGTIKEKLLTTKWKSTGTGNFNLYFAFFELGMTLLHNSGKLGYITPNNYFTSLAGIELRGYFSKNKKITKILNFNHLKIFENASTYTCITFMNKNYDNNHFMYHYLDNKQELDRLNELEFSKYSYKWLNDKKWRLMTEIEYNDIQSIETIGTPLGEICKIRVGIATLKDTVYFVEDFNQDYCKKMVDNKEHLIEKNITRKVIKISTLNSEKDISNDKRRIIFPYLKEDGKYKTMTEEFLKKNFPSCYSYLLTTKEELSTRDKGKQEYPIWFAWGRPQGMDFIGQRLYIPTFANKPNFMLDEKKDNLFCNGYAVFCEKHIRAIQKILNSKIMEFYIKKTSVEIEGDYQCYQKNFIEKFTIPNLTDEEWKFIEDDSNKQKLEMWLVRRYNLKSLT